MRTRSCSDHGLPAGKTGVDLCIDHHPSNSRYAAHLRLNTDAAATAEEVYAVLEALGVSLDVQIATCIYTGLSTDTGCFRYSNVTAIPTVLRQK